MFNDCLEFRTALACELLIATFLKLVKFARGDRCNRYHRWNIFACIVDEGKNLLYCFVCVVSDHYEKLGIEKRIFFNEVLVYLYIIFLEVVSLQDKIDLMVCLQVFAF